MSIKSPWIASYNDIKAHLEYPDTSIVDHLLSKVNDHPNNVAFEYYGTEVTYKELRERIKETAASLVAMGVKKGDIITVCTPNVPQGVVMFYAANYIGAIASMVHPLSSESEIEYYVNDTKSKIILTLDLFYEKVSAAVVNTNIEKIVVVSVSEDMKKVMSSLYWVTKGRKIPPVPKKSNVIFWKEFIDEGKKIKENIHVNVKGKDSAVILYSGGTTGTSKGVILTNLNFNALAIQAAEMVAPKDGKIHSLLAILPIVHGFGLGVCVNTPLVLGWKVILIPDFKASKYAELVKKYKPSFIVGVPTLYEAFIKTDLFKEPNSLEHVKVVISGGDKMNVESKREVNAFLAAHGSTAKVQEGYGLTESCGASCVHLGGSEKPDSIGIPFPDVYYKVVYTGTLNEADYGEEGEICISGPTVMKGYLNNPQETYQVLKKHSDGRVWLHTGDLGHMDKDGWVFFKQRLKRMIVSSGYCIYPNYIEKIINYHESVSQCVVVGIDDKYRVQKIRAYIILKDGVKHTEEVEKSIYDHCKKNIAKYSIPHEIEYIKEFPKTLVGKVSFKTLVSKDADLVIDPLLTKEEITEETIKKLQIKEMLNLKKMVEHTMKVTKRRSIKAMKLLARKEKKIQKEKIQEIKKKTKKKTKKRGE